MALVAKRLKAKDKVITNLRTLAGTIEGLRSQGKAVVLTNGCFDLLHLGHVRCLEDAKSRGDFLIVALNDDRAVTKLKGKGFPVNTVADRMETVAGLASVDYVTCFEEETADSLLKKLQPTIYAKGTDYTERTVPERATAKGLGAKIIICGDKKRRSTTKTVQRIRKRKFD